MLDTRAVCQRLSFLTLLGGSDTALHRPCFVNHLPISGQNPTAADKPHGVLMNTTAAILVTAHLFATTAMVGLIWFVQVVHYPLFASVGVDGFAQYERLHQRATSFVVGPLMAVEGATAIWLAVAPPDGVSRPLALLALAILGVIHASTVLLQVPQHTALTDGYDATRVRRLVRTNWVRTVGWSVRGIIAAIIVVHVSTF